MPFIKITNPDGAVVRINSAHIVHYAEYSMPVAGLTGTRIVLIGLNDEIQFAREQVHEIDALLELI